jgi:hypothetical protein
MSENKASINAARRKALYLEALERFPKPGAKLRYRGTCLFWFTDIIANAERELVVGEIYTLKTIEIFSSWASITLEETGETEFAFGFFEAIESKTE